VHTAKYSPSPSSSTLNDSNNKMSDRPDPANPTVRAIYTSPSTTKIFSNPISAPLPRPNSTTAVKDKVAYLAELRASTKRLQEEVNVFLTQKMKEDKSDAAAAAAGQDVGGESQGKKAAVEKSKEELEEENYGEEEMGDEES
jgi:Gon7 family